MLFQRWYGQSCPDGKWQVNLTGRTLGEQENEWEIGQEGLEGQDVRSVLFWVLYSIISIQEGNPFLWSSSSAETQLKNTAFP